MSVGEELYLLHFRSYTTKLDKGDGLYYVGPIERFEFSGATTRSKVIAANTSSDHCKIEGNKATRTHLKPRLWKFTPLTNNTYPGNGKVNDPRLFRLQESFMVAERTVI